MTGFGVTHREAPKRIASAFGIGRQEKKPSPRPVPGREEAYKRCAKLSPADVRKSNTATTLASEPIANRKCQWLISHHPRLSKEQDAKGFRIRPTHSQGYDSQGQDGKTKPRKGLTMSNLSYQPNQQDDFNHFENVRAAFAKASEAQSQPRRRPNPEFGRQAPAPVRHQGQYKYQPRQAQPQQHKPSISEQYAAFFRQPE